MEKEDFSRRVLACSDALYRIGYALLQNPADASDAVQTALMKVWERSAGLRPQTFRAYLTRAVVNECRTIQRQRMRAVPVAEPRAEDAYDPPDFALREALDSLEEAYRLPLLLCYMEGYTVKEAARALGITPAALKSRLFRARRLFQKRWEERP